MQKRKLKEIIKEESKMQDVLKNLVLAKAGDVIATEKILKRYEKYIDYEISTYGIDNVVDCKDEIIRVMLNVIQKFKI